MIWIILLYIFAAFLLLLLILLFLPFNCAARLEIAESSVSGDCVVSLIHPSICAIFFDSKTEEVSFSIFRRNLKRKRIRLSDEEEEKIIEPSGEAPAQKEVTVKGPEDSIVSRSETDKVSLSTGGPVTIPPPPQLEDEEENLQEEEEENPRQERPGLIERIRKSKFFFFIHQQKTGMKLYRWGLRVIKLLFTMVKFDLFSCRTRLGLDDPAEMGKIYGYFIALKNGLGIDGKRKIDLTMEPVFEKTLFELQGRIQVHTSLFRALIPVAAAVCTFPYLSTFIVWRKFKKSGSRK
jgi:hypothetical protein